MYLFILTINYMILLSFIDEIYKFMIVMIVIS